MTQPNPAEECADCETLARQYGMENLEVCEKCGHFISPDLDECSCLGDDQEDGYYRREQAENLKWRKMALAKSRRQW